MPQYALRTGRFPVNNPCHNFHLFGPRLGWWPLCAASSFRIGVSRGFSWACGTLNRRSRRQVLNFWTDINLFSAFVTSVRDCLFVDGRRLRLAWLPNFRQVAAGQDCRKRGAIRPISARTKRLSRNILARCGWDKLCQIWRGFPPPRSLGGSCAAVSCIRTSARPDGPTY
jgi:hypothetical protein